mgnify:CR=1 FL=1
MHQPSHALALAAASPLRRPLTPVWHGVQIINCARGPVEVTGFNSQGCAGGLLREPFVYASKCVQRRRRRQRQHILPRGQGAVGWAAVASSSCTCAAARVCRPSCAAARQRPSRSPLLPSHHRIQFRGSNFLTTEKRIPYAAAQGKCTIPAGTSERVRLTGGGFVQQPSSSPLALRTVSCVVPRCAALCWCAMPVQRGATYDCPRS